ncbi:hypothetical protein GCM10017776_37680 [Streptomyces griseoluteus]|nr:hypothetical protein GCM10017776_37680 [Streptomyces griseoluteus]
MDRSPHRRLRGELSGSGRLSCPATPPRYFRKAWLHPKPVPVSDTGSGTYLGSPAPAYGA